MEDLSVVALLGRLAVSMAVVLTLMGLAAKLLRRRGLGATGSAGTRIEVLARHGLGRTSSVQLVRVAGRTLVLGVTDTSVSLLGEGESLGLEVPDRSAAAGAPSGTAGDTATTARQLTWHGRALAGTVSGRSPTAQAGSSLLGAEPAELVAAGRPRPQASPGWGQLLESMKDRTARS